MFVQAFSKKKVEERKEWLTNFMVNRRQRREHNLPEVMRQRFVEATSFVSVKSHCHWSFSFFQDYLYGQSTKSLSYNDFVNKELVLFSNSDNERSIPCLVDGAWDCDYDSHVVKCDCTNLHLCLCVRSETRPEEGGVLLLQEEWQAGGEGGPVGWISSWDVSLPPWGGEMMLDIT